MHGRSTQGHPSRFVGNGWVIAICRSEAVFDPIPFFLSFLLLFFLSLFLRVVLDVFNFTCMRLVFARCCDYCLLLDSMATLRLSV